MQVQKFPAGVLPSVSAKSRKKNIDWGGMICYCHQKLRMLRKVTEWSKSS